MANWVIRNADGKWYRGFDGTPMPPWGDTLKDATKWTDAERAEMPAAAEKRLGEEWIELDAEGNPIEPANTPAPAPPAQMMAPVRVEPTKTPAPAQAAPVRKFALRLTPDDFQGDPAKGGARHERDLNKLKLRDTNSEEATLPEWSWVPVLVHADGSVTLEGPKRMWLARFCLASGFCYLQPDGAWLPSVSRARQFDTGAEAAKNGSMAIAVLVDDDGTVRLEEPEEGDMAARPLADGTPEPGATPLGLKAPAPEVKAPVRMRVQRNPEGNYFAGPDRNKAWLPGLASAHLYRDTTARPMNPDNVMVDVLVHADGTVTLETPEPGSTLDVQSEPMTAPAAIEKPKRVVVVQKWEESESGWGVRPDGWTMHLTEQDRDAFVKEFWDSQPPGPAPECYSRPSGTPYSIEVDEETYEKVKASKNGVDGKGNMPPVGSQGKDGFVAMTPLATDAMRSAGMRTPHTPDEMIALMSPAGGSPAVEQPVAPAVEQPAQPAPAQPRRMWVVSQGDGYYDDCATDLASARRYPCEQTLQFLPGRNIPVLVHADGTVTLDEDPETTATADAIRAAFERGRAEGARNEECKRAWVADEYRRLQAELAEAKANLFAVKADKDNVWFWQRNDPNEPETLRVPIVMWPDELIEIRARAFAEGVASRGEEAAPRRVQKTDEAPIRVPASWAAPMPASEVDRLRRDLLEACELSQALDLAIGIDAGAPLEVHEEVDAAHAAVEAAALAYVAAKRKRALDPAAAVAAAERRAIEAYRYYRDLVGFRNMHEDVGDMTTISIEPINAAISQAASACGKANDAWRALLEERNAKPAVGGGGGGGDPNTKIAVVHLDTRGAKEGGA